ncbi:MAG TPA: serine hydrolase domain-containing protein [Pseudonocardia sp.]|uniref:serine hydrolase domain-containing protein n=1 Tax=Pseudonocardia sp. TaxID=60912 RepID=UPI002ED88E73
MAASRTPDGHVPTAGVSPSIGRRALLSGAAALGLGVLAAACSTSAAPPAPPATGPAPAAPGPATSPPQAEALRARFEAVAKELTAPGAAMLLRTPSGEQSATYGFRTLAGTEPITMADHARVGSVTKTLTATCILQLAQEGRVDVGAPVSEYRPDVPNGKNIPVSRLLEMRSGLYNYSESLELNKSLDENPGKVWTPEELLALGYQHPPYFPPGTGYHYSNTNYVLLGLIIEQLDKKPLAAAYQARLFTPLNMRETSLPPADSIAIPQPHPHGYQYGSNVATMNGEGLPPDQQPAAFAGRTKPNDVTDENPSWTWAAGGGISTIANLATWATAMGDGTLLNPTWQRRRLESIQPIDPANPASLGYGMGIAKFGPMYGHTGELPGFQAFCGYDPDRKTTLAVWANLNAAPDGRAVASTIAQQLIGVLYA